MHAKTLPWALSTKRKDAQGSDLAETFEDFSQDEKLSKIKQ